MFAFEVSHVPWFLPCPNLSPSGSIGQLIRSDSEVPFQILDHQFELKISCSGYWPDTGRLQAKLKYGIGLLPVDCSSDDGNAGE